MDEKKLYEVRFDLAIKFFPEKYFTIYLRHRTAFFSHMTARPPAPESRRKPVSAAVALVLVMVAVLLVVGCIGCMLIPTGCIEPGYAHNRDIAVTKLTPDGSLSWYKVIDTGRDDTADDIISSSDSSFVISARLSDINRQGGRYPYLVKMSGDGNFIWNRSIYESNCDSGTLTNTRKGEIVIVFGNQFCRFNRDGELLSNETSDITNGGNIITTTHEGGYIIGGVTAENKPFTKEEFISSGRSELNWEQLCGNITPPENPFCGGNHTIIQTTIAKMNANDTKEWSHSLGEYGFTRVPIAIVELKNNRGYFVQIINESNYVCSVHLDANGKYITSMPFATYNPEGNQLAIPIFNNTSTIITQTDEGDYLSAGFPGPTQFLESYLYHSGTAGNLHVVKLSPEGIIQWDRAVPNVTVNKVNKIIQTTDGAYIILCENEKNRSL